MTESLKNILRGAKTLDEAYGIMCVHADEFSMEDQMKMMMMASGRSELTEEELDMITGGSWSSIWKSVKNAGKAAANATAVWCKDHKRELIIAGCILAGAAIGAAGAGVLLATAGQAVAWGAGVTAAEATANVLVWGGIAGSIIGATVGGVVTRNMGGYSNDYDSDSDWD